jgi:ubiquinone/menaquinone biosynthesis C-methylase UbiE
MKKTWKNVFEDFNKDSLKKKYSLKELLRLAGHLNSKTGSYDLRKWNSETKKIKQRIRVREGKLLEIGCGTGALLKKFENDFQIYGSDYSDQMLNVARIAIPKGKFNYEEASKIDYKKNFFDVIILFSTVQYFPDLQYFKKTLSKIKNQLKKNGILYIGEIIEKKKQFNFNKFRKNQLTKKEFKEKYSGKENVNLKHFALDRTELINLIKSSFKNIEIYDSIKRGKEQFFFRFDVYCKKK